MTLRCPLESKQIIRNAGYSIVQTPISIGLYEFYTMKAVYIYTTKSITKSRISLDVNGQPGSGAIISSTLSARIGMGIVSNGMKAKVATDTHDEKSKTFTLFFNESNAQSEELCGGKGSSLAILTQLANDEMGRNALFIVPQGFTLTIDAFDHQLKHSARLSETILRIENVACNRSNGSLDDACKE